MEEGHPMLDAHPDHHVAQSKKTGDSWDDDVLAGTPYRFVGKIGAGGVGSGNSAASVP
jgi:hypothetical protein